MSYQKFGLVLLFAASMSMFVSCNKDKNKGSAQIEITDAPIDNTNISGTFVTIADIKVDGESLEGFNKTTIDLMAYQNGSTKVLGNFDLDAKTYNSITLVLDHETDASGASPGCYVLDINGAKHALATTATEINVTKSMDVAAQATSNFVLDFDLRKSIKQTSTSGSDQYDFVTSAELQSAVRVVNKGKAAKIQGSITDNTGSDRIVVYAYKKGTYTRNSEVQGQGASNIEFSKAVTSAAVDANGNYTLSFLDEGEYEVYYASYERNSEGRFELRGTLNVSAISSIDLLGLMLNAEATLTINVTVLGLLPL